MPPVAPAQPEQVTDVIGLALNRRSFDACGPLCATASRPNMLTHNPFPQEWLATPQLTR